MSKWIYKIEESFEPNNSGMASDIASIIAFIAALAAGASWLSF